MRRFIFVIDGEGVENWMPMDLEFGEKFHGGVYYGPEFYKERARLNWDRGCYCIETELSRRHEKRLVRLVGKRKKWLKAKSFVEELTGRNFETETGFENPYDPEWNHKYDRAWQQKRSLWLERAGVSDFDPMALVMVKTNEDHRCQLSTKAQEIIIDGAKRSIGLLHTFPFIPEPLKHSMIPVMESNFPDFHSAE
jgi:hypothetical protein